MSKWRRKYSLQIVSSQIQKIILDSNRNRRFGDFLHKQKAEKIIGLDISVGMLEVEKKIATKKTSETIEMVLADSENMPLKTIILMRSAFGVRNFETLEKD
jgi:demethylmenaquinone methyltransferase/2-methoxy-6-polyprenyl-1,4-benzoquinol methylase